MSRSLQDIQTTIRAARDSVWVINDEIQKMQASGTLTTEQRNTIQRNVDHLHIVNSDPEITGSGEDISDLVSAITLGETTIANNPI